MVVWWRRISYQRHSALGRLERTYLVVSTAVVLCNKAEKIVWYEQISVLLIPFSNVDPKRRDGTWDLVHGKYESILLLVLLHESERIVIGQIAKVLDVWLYSPVVLVLEQELVTEEESRLKSAHLSIRL